MYTCITIIYSYLLGSINWAYLFGKRKGMDIREEGTGNAGTTNVMFIMGKKAGLLVFALDILKTVLAMSLTAAFFPRQEYLLAVSGVSSVLGHCFPYYMGFRGGKGSACFLGLVLRLSPLLVPFMVLIAFLIAFFTDIAFLFPVSAIIIYPFLIWLTRGDLTMVIWLCLLIPLTLYMHRSNVGKVRSGEENGFREVMFRKVKGYGKDAKRE